MLNDQANYHQSISDPYELMISKEDHHGEIPGAIAGVVDMRGKDLLDLGAGTGRFACMFAPFARTVTATDFAADMLRVAADRLARMGCTNWKTAVADNRGLPLADHSVDVVLSGWSICYLGSSNNPQWREDLQRVMDEIERVLRPGGTVILFETLGTGNTKPIRNKGLAGYFQALEEQYTFRHRVLRTDYRFDDAGQAEKLCRDFFGDELGGRIKRERLSIVPECTGMWWKTYD